jgi:hypothetical protein
VSRVGGGLSTTVPSSNHTSGFSRGHLSSGVAPIAGSELTTQDSGAEIRISNPNFSEMRLLHLLK